MTVKVSFDLAKEFKDILKEYGRNVLVLRRNKQKYCSCYNEVTREASRTCGLCLGLGWSYIAEKHTTRSEDEADPAQLVKLMSSTGIGDVIAGDRQYYFLPNVQATEKDLIIEVDWDRFGRPTYNGKGIYSISAIDRNQDLGAGKEVYKIFHAAETPVRSKIRGIRVGEIQGIKTYEILMEG